MHCCSLCRRGQEYGKQGPEETGGGRRARQCSHTHLRSLPCLRLPVRTLACISQSWAPLKMPVGSRHAETWALGEELLSWWGPPLRAVLAGCSASVGSVSECPEQWLSWGIFWPSVSTFTASLWGQKWRIQVAAHHLPQPGTGRSLLTATSCPGSRGGRNAQERAGGDVCVWEGGREAERDRGTLLIILKFCQN